MVGNSTKIHLAVDSCGNPIDFILTGCVVHDNKAAPELVELLTDSKSVGQTGFMIVKPYEGLF